MPRRMNRSSRARLSHTDSNWTWPNVITVVRILITPAFVTAFVNEHFLIAWLLFGAAGISDALDGILARMLRQRSPLGAMLDPLADKVMLVTAFLALAFKGWLPSWLAILVVSRDVIIVGGLTVLNFWGVDVRRRIAPSWASKFNTMFQISLVFLVLLEKTFVLDWSWLKGGLSFLVAGLTLYTGFHYVALGFTFFGNDRE